MRLDISETVAVDVAELNTVEGPGILNVPFLKTGLRLIVAALRA